MNDEVLDSLKAQIKIEETAYIIELKSTQKVRKAKSYQASNKRANPAIARNRISSVPFLDFTVLGNLFELVTFKTPTNWFYKQGSNFFCLRCIHVSFSQAKCLTSARRAVCLLSVQQEQHCQNETQDDQNERQRILYFLHFTKYLLTLTVSKHSLCN